jgi:hypothetical protein
MSTLARAAAPIERAQFAYLSGMDRDIRCDGTLRFSP